jgi:DMSO reductase anchor subunit
MHPAPSLILFTTLSGLGLGGLAWALLALAQTPDNTSIISVAATWGLSAAGLMLSSTHLKNPKNAWRAFSQPGSSWLSREAWLAVITMACAPIVATALILQAAPAALVALPILLALATIAATAMIYTQLKTVPRWHSPWTPTLFVALALAGGALLTGRGADAAGLMLPAGIALAGYWLAGDKRVGASRTTMATATGLTQGTVRAFESPHTGDNYLLKEMVHIVARKHARRLRAIGFGLAIILPVLLLTLMPVIPTLAVLALHLAGVLTTRWLFFAEAEHVVGLYYGKR